MGRIHERLRLVGQAILNPWKTYKKHVIEPRERKLAANRAKLAATQTNPTTVSTSLGYARRAPSVPRRPTRSPPARTLRGLKRQPVLHGSVTTSSRRVTRR